MVDLGMRKMFYRSFCRHALANTGTTAARSLRATVLTRYKTLRRLPRVCRQGFILVRRCVFFIYLFFKSCYFSSAVCCLIGFSGAIRIKTTIILVLRHSKESFLCIVARLGGDTMG